MWKFLTKVLGKSSEPQPVAESSQRVSSMLEAIQAGVSQNALPTLVCRTCGLKYNNTGTYLSGSKCPDCSEAVDAKSA